MFLVPYFLRKPLPSLIQWNLLPISLFLENRGKGLCSVGSAADVTEWLSDNGFVSKGQWMEGDVFYIEIDTEKTKLNDFYSLEQLTKEPHRGTEECWVTYYVMKSVASTEAESEKAWNENIEAPFGKILKAIQNHGVCSP